MENANVVKIANSNEVKRPSFPLPRSLVTWEGYQFPHDFLKNYLAELLKLQIIDKKIMDFFEGKEAGGREKKIQNIDIQTDHFQVLFKHVDKAHLNADNHTLQLKLETHSPRILPLWDFIKKVIKDIKTFEGWALIKINNHDAVEKNLSPNISESYALLDCYASIFSFSTHKHRKIDLAPRLLPALLEKSLEIGRVDLAHWCMENISKAHWPVSPNQECKVLETAFDCLLSHINASSSVPLSFFKNWHAIVLALIEKGARVPSQSMIKRLFWILTQYQLSSGCLISPLPLDDPNQFSKRVNETFTPLLSTVLLMDPMIWVSSSHEEFFAAMVGFILSKDSNEVERSAYYLHAEKTGFLGFNYSKEKAFRGEMKKWKRYGGSISLDFIIKVLENVISWYGFLKPTGDPFSKQKIFSQLLDWLGEQSVSVSQLINKTVKGYSIEEEKKISQIIKLIPQLLKARIGLSYVDEEGMSLLHKAVLYRWSALVHALLQAGVDPNTPMASGHTALHLALSEKEKPVDTKLAKLLICHPNMELKHQDNHGWTPLHLLIALKDVSLLDFFLKKALETKRDIDFEARTNWRIESPRRDSTKSKAGRWTSFVVSTSEWGKHKKTAMELAEMYQLDELLQKLRWYRLSQHQDAWSEKKDEREVIEIQEEIIFVEEIKEQSIEKNWPEKLIEENPIAAFTIKEDRNTLEKEMVELKKQLFELSEKQGMQETEHLSAEKKLNKRLNEIESILDESLQIAKRYKNEIKPFPLRCEYYRRVRAEVATNFTASLLLTSKLIQPWQGKLDDACGSHSLVDALLNITVISSEAFEPIVEGLSVAGEGMETLANLIRIGLNLGLEAAKETSSNIPIIGNGINTGLRTVNGASWLLEFYRELKKIDHAHHALMDLTPREVEHLAEKIAIRMTHRVKDILEFLTDEGLKQLANFDYRRMVLGLLTGEFKKNLSLDTIINTLCGYRLNQDRLFFRIPLKGKVAIRKDKVADWLKSNYSLTVPSKNIPDKVNENWLHDGIEVAMEKICRQIQVNIPKKKEHTPSPTITIKVKQEYQEAEKKTNLLSVKERSNLLDRFSNLEKENEALKIEIKGCKLRIEELKKENSQESINNKNKIAVLENIIVSLDNKTLSDNLLNEEKKQKKNLMYFLQGWDNYKRGKEYYILSTNEKISLEYRLNNTIHSLHFFSQAKNKLNKVNSSLLKEKELKKFIKLRKNLEENKNCQPRPPKEEDNDLNTQLNT